jgi:hypothetical protein
MVTWFRRKPPSGNGIADENLYAGCVKTAVNVIVY